MRRARRRSCRGCEPHFRVLEQVVDEAAASGRWELRAALWERAHERRGSGHALARQGEHHGGDRRGNADPPRAHGFTIRAQRFASILQITGSFVTARVKWNAPAAKTRAPRPVS